MELKSLWKVRRVRTEANRTRRNPYLSARDTVSDMHTDCVRQETFMLLGRFSPLKDTALSPCHSVFGKKVVPSALTTVNWTRPSVFCLSPPLYGTICGQSYISRTM